jgi:fibronectin type 3 domain-containing protein
MKRALLRTVALFLLSGALLGQKQTATAPHSVTISWQAPARAQGSAPVRYNVYRSDDGGRSYSPVIRLTGETSYTDRSVESGHTYQYVVTSTDAAGRESARPAPIVVTIP